MKKLQEKEYKEINFVKYHSKEYGLIFENDDEIIELLLDDVGVKALAGKMLMLIEAKNLAKNLKTPPNKDFKAQSDSPKVCPYCNKDLPNYVFSDKFCKKCDNLMRIAPDGGYHCENCYGKL